MNYSNLKTQDIISRVYENTHQEISGQEMQEVLLALVESLGKGYQFMGEAKPDVEYGTPDERVFYIAIEDGVYMEEITLDNELAFITFDTEWRKISIPQGGGGGEVSKEYVDRKVEDEKDRAEAAEELIKSIADSKLTRIDLACDGYEPLKITYRGDTRALTFQEIYDLVTDKSKFVTLLDSEMFILLPSLSVDGDAIEFAGINVMSHQAEAQRVIINQENQVSVYPIELEDSGRKVSSAEGISGADAFIKYPNVKALQDYVAAHGGGLTPEQEQKLNESINQAKAEQVAHEAIDGELTEYGSISTAIKNHHDSSKQNTLTPGTNISIEDNVISSQGIPDAPSDGKQYARKDGAWSEVAQGGESDELIAEWHYPIDDYPPIVFSSYDSTTGYFYCDNIPSWATNGMDVCVEITNHDQAANVIMPSGNNSPKVKLSIADDHHIKIEVATIPSAVNVNAFVLRYVQTTNLICISPESMEQEGDTYLRVEMVDVSCNISRYPSGLRINSSAINTTQGSDACGTLPELGYDATRPISNRGEIIIKLINKGDDGGEQIFTQLYALKRSALTTFTTSLIVATSYKSLNLWGHNADKNVYIHNPNGMSISTSSIKVYKIKKP